MGSFKGAYIHAFLMAQSGSANESEIFRYLEMSSRNNHRPALTAIGFQKLFLHDDCPSALNHYRTSAVLAINQIDSTFFGDYASLQNLTMGPDSLGDDAATKAARDVETINYWNFQADRRDSRAFYELGKIYQLGLLGARRDMEKAAGI
jgi:TPR repeat protein